MQLLYIYIYILLKQRDAEVVASSKKCLQAPPH